MADLALGWEFVCHEAKNRDELEGSHTKASEALEAQYGRKPSIGPVLHPIASIGEGVVKGCSLLFFGDLPDDPAQLSFPETL